MASYLVVWSIGDSVDTAVDHYSAHTDGNDEENLKTAQAEYKKLLEQDDLYSATIAKVVESTDYGS